MVVNVVKDGKEFGQGVAYLDDGTMIVVEGGKKHIGDTIEVLVTSVLQTAAGRMIFEMCIRDRRITPPYGGKMQRNRQGWSGKTVLRLLLHEVHLGYMIYGKTKTVKDKVLRIKREDWVRVQGHHEILKTLEEHERILRKREASLLAKKRTCLLYTSRCV